MFIDLGSMIWLQRSEMCLMLARYSLFGALKSLWHYRSINIGYLRDCEQNDLSLY